MVRRKTGIEAGKRVERTEEEEWEKPSSRAGRRARAR